MRKEEHTKIVRQMRLEAKALEERVESRTARVKELAEKVYDQEELIVTLLNNQADLTYTNDRLISALEKATALLWDATSGLKNAGAQAQAQWEDIMTALNEAKGTVFNDDQA